MSPPGGVQAQDYTYVLKDQSPSSTLGLSMTQEGASAGAGIDFSLKDNVRMGLNSYYEFSHWGKNQDPDIEISPLVVGGSLAFLDTNTSKEIIMITSIDYSIREGKIVSGSGHGAKGGVSLLAVTANPIKVFQGNIKDNFRVAGVSFSSFIPFGTLKNNRGKATIKPDIGFLLLPGAGIVRVDPERGSIFSASISAGFSWSKETEAEFVLGGSASFHFF